MLIAIRFVALVQLLGGVFGLVVVIQPIVQGSAELNAYVDYIAFIFYGVSLVAAIWLWQRQPRGFVLSIIIQSMQLILIELPTFVYWLVSGFYIAFGPDNSTSAALDISVGYSGYWLCVGECGQNQFFAVNIWAIVAVSILVVGFQKRKQQES